MTAALVQKCNKCSRPFVKLSGCNKMTCTCGNLQCYVCGQNIKDYNHFEQGRGNGTKCPLHENNDSRLEAKILNAREEAVKKVLEEEEGLNEEDVKVDAPVTNVMAGMPARVMGDLRDRGAAFVNQIQGMMGFAQGIEHHVWQGAPVILGPYIGVQTLRTSVNSRAKFLLPLDDLCLLLEMDIAVTCIFLVRPLTAFNFQANSPRVAPNNSIIVLRCRLHRFDHSFTYQRVRMSRLVENEARMGAALCTTLGMGDRDHVCIFQFS
jgi:hypothetical protein